MTAQCQRCGDPPASQPDGSPHPYCCDCWDIIRITGADVPHARVDGAPGISLLSPEDRAHEQFRTKLMEKLAKGESLTPEDRQRMFDMASLRVMGGRRAGAISQTLKHFGAPLEGDDEERPRRPSNRPSAKDLGLG